MSSYSQVRFFRKGNLWQIASAALASIFFSVSGHALDISEDFTYPSLSEGDAIVTAGSGGSGWKAGWEGNNQILYGTTAENNPVSTKYGLVQEPGSGSLYSNTANYRAISREFEHEISGEIWFSYLFRKGGTGAGGLIFNATGAHAKQDAGSSSPPEFQVAVDIEGQLGVILNGTGTPAGAVANGTDYLVLGRMVTGANGSLQVWLNPDLNGVTTAAEFLSSSQPPVFSIEDTDMPNVLFSVGLSAFRGSGKSSVFRLDALRVSDGEKNANEAFKAAIGITPASP